VVGGIPAEMEKIRKNWQWLKKFKRP
jgi:hypothetical protein